jgi:hypothetical protein
MLIRHIVFQIGAIREEFVDPEVLIVDGETPGFSLEDPGICPYPRFSY